MGLENVKNCSVDKKNIQTTFLSSLAKRTEFAQTGILPFDVIKFFYSKSLAKFAAVKLMRLVTDLNFQQGQHFCCKQTD